jgi:hypothetical protein
MPMRAAKSLMIGALLAVVLQACPAQASEPVRIRLGWVVPITDWALFMLEKRDLARHSGESYVLEPARFASSSSVITAMANNELEIGNLAFSTLGLAIQNAGLRDLRVISDLFQDGRSNYFTNEYLVRRDSAIPTVGEDPGTQLPKLGFVSGKSSRRLKIAVMYEGMQGQLPHPEVRKAIDDAAQLCRELGHAVDEATVPLDQTMLSDAAERVGAVEIARSMDAVANATGLTAFEDGFESRAVGLREEALCRGPFDQQIAAALPTLKAGTATLDQFFRQWDVLLSAVVREPVFKTGMRDQRRFSFQELEALLRDYAAYTSLHNICGTTAMSVPLFWDCEGLPLGSQFAARIGAEARLLELAYELEEARPWASKRPPVFVL